MTTTASPIALAELTKVRSSGHHDYPDRAEPRSLALELAPAPNSTSSSSYSTRHHHGSYSDYDQQFGNNGNNNGTNNGHHSHHSSTSSSSSYHPQSSSAYLPPPIQTSSYNNNTTTNNNNNSNNSNNNNTHSFTSPSSPAVPSSPLSPITYPPSTSGHYDYDHPQGQYYPPYQSNHSSYPQEHHHPLSPATEGSGHYFYGSQPIPTGKVETGGNGSYSSSSSSSHYPRNHPYYSNHHGSVDEHPDSPPSSMPIGGMMSNGNGNGNGNGHGSHSGYYSTSAPSPSMASPTVRPKRRSEVVAHQESPYFYPAQQHQKLLSLDQTISYNLKVSARIDRGFFLAANDWTCYRRNYFQLSAAFSFQEVDSMMHPEPPCLLDRNGELLRVRCFMICIGAQIQNGEKIIELVQHTPKRDKGPQMTPQPTRVRAGGDLTMSSSNMNPNVITFERVQFKTATANNGKRRAAQQYYQVHVDLFAELEGGELVLVASAFSAPLVVRGRSPGHYADNEDSHLSVSSHTMDGRHPYSRSDSIGGGPLSPTPGNGYAHFGGYSYGSSYPYQSLGSASHLAQSHDGNYYDRDESYPSSPLSPPGAHQGASVSPDMYSPSGFSGPESPTSFPRLPQLHNHGSHYPYGSYSQSYRSDSHFEDHETQMAGLRIHSPTSPIPGSANPVVMSAPSSPSGTPRRQSFSTSLLSSKKSERGVGSANNTRKSRSISLSGTMVSKRSSSKTRSIRTVPLTPSKDLGRISGGAVNGGSGGLVGGALGHGHHNNGHHHSNGHHNGHGHGLGFSKDRIPESLMEDNAI